MIVKKQATEMEKLLITHISHKELVSRTTPPPPTQTHTPTDQQKTRSRNRKLSKQLEQAVDTRVFSNFQ